MKKFFIVALAIMAISAVSLKAQGEAASQETGKNIPIVTLKDLEGNNFNTEELQNDGQPMIISFWATWCKPCVLELNTIYDEYEDWQAETGVKLVAISIDDARNSNKVAPFVNGKGWEYEVYLDENQDFKRALGVNNVPHTFLVNGEGQIVWDHNSYSPGDEEELYEKVKHLAAGEAVEDDSHE